jgi:uncharacterized membrane protein
MRLASVAALGIPGGMRSFLVPATLSLRGTAFAGPLKYILAGAAAGELVADKQPGMASRLAPRGLSFRIVGGALAGNALAGPRGALATSAVAGASAWASHGLRAALAQRLGSDLPAAITEDVVAIALVVVLTR